MHSIVSVSLHPSIGVNSMFKCLSDHAIYVKLIFRNITAIANSTIVLWFTMCPLSLSSHIS